MNIWLDRAPTSYHDGGDNQQIRAGIFQQHVSLHVQTISDERWLVCNPITIGKVAVLDAQALSLLTQFSTPKTIAEIMQCTSGWSLRSIEKAVALFLELGFLEGICRDPGPHQEEQIQVLSAWLHITNACNLRCHYCYLHKTNEHMSEDVFRRAVDATYRSARQHHFKHVRLKYAGGEASLYLARVLAIHDYAAKLAQQYEINLHAYILSNGVMLSQRLIDEFQVRCIGITISLDGIGTHHDVQRPFINGQPSFKYVDQTIHQLLACGLVPHISVTISQRNLDGLPDLIEYILEREMPFTLNYYRDNECSTHLRDLQFTDEHMIAVMRVVFDIIEQRLPRRSLLSSLIDKANLTTIHHHTCSVGRNYLVVDQRGGIAKCHAEIEQTITTVDVEDPLQMIRENRTGVQGVSVEEKEGCRTCQWRFWCTGGCPLLTYQATGRSDVKSPYCNIYKALFPLALLLESKRLLKYGLPIAL